MKRNILHAASIALMILVSTGHAKTPDGLVDEDDKKGAAAAPAEVPPVVEAASPFPIYFFFRVGVINGAVDPIAAALNAATKADLEQLQNMNNPQAQPNSDNA